MTLPIQAPKPVIDDTFLSRLAMELATSLYGPDTIFTQFGIDKDYYFQYIHNHPAFIAFYREYHAIWTAGDNATVRVTKKAGVLLEAFLPKLHHILHDDHTPASAKSAFAQWLSKLSGADNVHALDRDIDAARLTPTVTINIAAVQAAPARQIVVGPTPPVIDAVPTQVSNGPEPDPVSAPPPQMLPPVINLPQPRVGMPSAPLPGAVMGAPMPVRSPDGKPADMDRFTAARNPRQAFPAAPIVNDVDTSKW